mgnify:CR=1
MENLSQEEIDALLEEAADDASDMEALEDAAGGGSGASAEGGAGPRERVVEAFDFNRPNNNLSKTFERNLRGVSESFAKDASLSFSNLLRANADYTFGGMRVNSFAETLSAWENPSCIAVCSMEPLSGVILVHLEARLMFTFFTKLLGGPIEEPTQVRDFTEIEMGLARKVLTKVLEQFSAATDKIHRVVPLLIQIENNPNYLNAFAEAEPVLNLQYTVTLEDVGATMSFVIPLAAFDPVREDFDPREGLDIRSAADRLAEKQRAHGLVGGATATLSARFRSRRIHMNELLSLKPGDVLALEHHVERPLDVDVEGRAMFAGSSGRIGRARAVQIIGRREDA